MAHSKSNQIISSAQVAKHKTMSFSLKMVCSVGFELGMLPENPLSKQGSWPNTGSHQIA
jgi:hypothetical protein